MSDTTVVETMTSSDYYRSPLRSEVNAWLEDNAPELFVTGLTVVRGRTVFAHVIDKDDRGTPATVELSRGRHDFVRRAVRLAVEAPPLARWKAAA